MSASRPLAQPTAWGRPPSVKNRRFFKIAGRWLTKVRDYMHFGTVFLWMAALAQLIYVGIFVKHNETYVSDGTVFSCKVDYVRKVRQ